MGRTRRCRVRVGCAGWAIPRIAAARLATEGSHLARYAAAFDAVEINSSFHRPHAATVYARWAATVPRDFRFAVKAPRTITHEHALVDADEELARFLDQVSGLGTKLGPLLVQLPPSHEHEPRVAARFFRALRARFDGLVALEPRHRSWCSPEADRMLVDLAIARVAADPPAGGCGEPGGSSAFRYVRLHGSPRVYWSSYDAADLGALGDRLRALAATAPVWCVFDNTAAGAASLNALDLRARLGAPRARPAESGAAIAVAPARRRT